MKTADCDILIIPGHGNSGPDHWQSRWERRLPTARRVAQANWDAPDRQTWIAAILAAVAAAERPAVLVAHSLGALTVAHAALPLAGTRVAAAFLVAPPDTERPDVPAVIARSYGKLPTDPLPFPAMLVASRNDPWCSFTRADDMAADWGAALVDAGEAGHINAAAGYGPWPEGLTRLATLLSRV